MPSAIIAGRWNLCLCQTSKALEAFGGHLGEEVGAAREVDALEQLDAQHALRGRGHPAVVHDGERHVAGIHDHVPDDLQPPPQHALRT